ncbi:MAG: aspartate kinase, partial [Proteobacteria bacterium]|nr:aspartate kinase [Pseudomonadota bacterium]
MSVVIKFGGTSIETATLLRKAAKIIKCDNNIRVVVVSALGSLTDKLIEFSKNPSHNLYLDIKNRHIKIALDLSLDQEIIESIENILNPIYGFIHNRRNIQNNDIDLILSVGEKLSSFLLFSLLIHLKCNAHFLNADDIIITDDSFCNAIPDIQASKKMWMSQKSLYEGGVIITQGFIGSTSKQKIITTLGRGGSDFSAALFARIIDATALRIYTDVMGVYTADPNIVDDAKLISNISFTQMNELARFGAKILHPRALMPCIEEPVIPVTILSMHSSDSKCTIIDNMTESENDKNHVIAIATRRFQCLLIVSKSNNSENHLKIELDNIVKKYHISYDILEYNIKTNE